MSNIFTIISIAFIGIFIFPSSVFAQASRTLVISEIQTGGLSDNNVELTSFEFLELKNTTNMPLTLNGVKVEYLTGSGNVTAPILATLKGVVQPQGYILIAHNDFIAPQNAVVDFRFG